MRRRTPQNPRLKKDQSFENLKPLVTGKIPALFVADTARDITRAERMADEFHMPLIIEGAREGYRELDSLKGKHIPVILSVDVTDAPSRKVETGPDATPQAVLDDRYDTWKEHSVNGCNASTKPAFRWHSASAQVLRTISRGSVN